MKFTKFGNQSGGLTTLFKIPEYFFSKCARLPRIGFLARKDPKHKFYRIVFWAHFPACSFNRLRCVTTSTPTLHIVEVSELTQCQAQHSRADLTNGAHTIPRSAFRLIAGKDRPIRHLALIQHDPLNVRPKLMIHPSLSPLEPSTRSELIRRHPVPSRPTSVSLLRISRCAAG